LCSCAWDRIVLFDELLENAGIVVVPFDDDMATAALKNSGKVRGLRARGQ